MGPLSMDPAMRDVLVMHPVVMLIEFSSLDDMELVTMLSANTVLLYRESVALIEVALSTVAESDVTIAILDDIDDDTRDDEVMIADVNASVCKDSEKTVRTIRDPSTVAFLVTLRNVAVNLSENNPSLTTTVSD